MKIYAAILIASLTCVGCYPVSKEALDSRLNLPWPCGISDLMLSPSGDSILVSRITQKAPTRELDLSRYFGRVIVVSHGRDTEYSQIDIKTRVRTDIHTSGRPFWMNGALYFDIDDTVVPASDLKNVMLKQSLPRGYNRCDFDFSIPQNSDVSDICLQHKDDILTHISSTRLRIASKSWTVSAIKKLTNPLVVFTRQGQIAMVIERGPQGEAKAVYRVPGNVAPLPNPDQLSFILPTETKDGELGFWTDTPLEEDDVQVAEYKFNAGGHAIRVGAFSDPFYQVTFRQSIGQSLNRLSPESRLQLAPPTGPDGGRSYALLGRRSLIRSSNHVSVWLEQDNTHTQKVLAQVDGQSSQTIATCKRDFPQQVELVDLVSPTIGHFPAYWTIFDGKVAAPLAIELHGGPSGTLSSLQNADNLFESTTGVMLRAQGFQALSINYPGSGVVGRSFRNRLSNHAADVATAVVAASNMWARKRSGDPAYRPVLVGGSYGAYLAAVALSHELGNSGYILDSGIYDPDIELKASSYFKTGDDVYKQEGIYFSPQKVLSEKASSTDTNTPVLLSYSPKDARVSPYDTEAFARILAEKKFNYRLFGYDKGTHSTSVMYLSDDAQANAYIASMKQAAGSFKTVR